MNLVAHTLRFLADRYLADAHRSSMDTARANAAEASARLRRRRHERADVDAYLRARLEVRHGADEARAGQGREGVEHAR